MFHSLWKYKRNVAVLKVYWRTDENMLLKFCFVSLLPVYKTSRFHVAMCPFSSRSQNASKRWHTRWKWSVSVLFLPHFDFCNLLLNRCTATYNLLDILLVRAVFIWISKSYGFSFATLHDWLKKFALIFHPIKSKTKTNRDSLAHVFPRL